MRWLLDCELVKEDLRRQGVAEPEVMAAAVREYAARQSSYYKSLFERDIGRCLEKCARVVERYIKKLGNM